MAQEAAEQSEVAEAAAEQVVQAADAVEAAEQAARQQQLCVETQALALLVRDTHGREGVLAALQSITRDLRRLCGEAPAPSPDLAGEVDACVEEGAAGAVQACGAGAGRTAPPESEQAPPEDPEARWARISQDPLGEEAETAIIRIRALEVRNRELEKEAQLPRKFDEVGQTGAAAGGRAAAVLAQPVRPLLGVLLEHVVAVARHEAKPRPGPAVGAQPGVRKPPFAPGSPPHPSTSAEAATPEAGAGTPAAAAVVGARLQDSRRR
jgi:hypothetical protein